MQCNLQEACEQFFLDRETYCRDRTVDNYKNTLRYFREFIEERKGLPAAEIDVCSISSDDLKVYSIYLKNKSKNDNHTLVRSDPNVKISDRTRKDYLKDAKAFFNFLVSDGTLEENPADKLKLPKVSAQPIEVLTNDEVSILDDCYRLTTKFGCRNLAIIHCLLDEGMRSGEVQRLKISDLHFDEEYIVIRNSKGGKGRILPMARVVKKYLTRYINEKRPEVTHDFVFCTDTGAPLSQDSIKCLFDRLKKKSGITRIYPHLLRHTFATSFILGGGSVEFLRIYMGHSSIETTQKYLHLANNLRFCKNVYRLDKCFVKQTY